MRDHRGAGTGRANDVVELFSLEHVEEVTGDATRLIHKTGVECRLAATSLAFGVGYFDAEFA